LKISIFCLRISNQLESLFLTALERKGAGKNNSGKNLRERAGGWSVERGS
jgi:hypothetical protein